MKYRNNNNNVEFCLAADIFIVEIAGSFRCIKLCQVLFKWKVGWD